MDSFWDTARRLKDWWVLGLLVLFMTIMTGAVAAAAAAIILLPALELLGYGGTDETWPWLALTAALWLPVWIGYLADTQFRKLPRLPLNKRAAGNGTPVRS